jgi:hypothetical protein
MQMAEEDVLLTTQEAGRRLRKRPQTMMNWRWSGGGPEWIKIGGSVLYKTSAIEKFINEAPPRGLRAPVRKRRARKGRKA